MSKRRSHNRAQLALGLERPLPPYPAAAMANPEGLLAALADLLLSALGDKTMTTEGDCHERQDRA